ncbi:hypothetical protein QR680_012586 [Steinernema hermaphroditum]|uniref:Uncharacterized protein n=1 Tax=Steinernema hermaphroditum TaxID=289476 RepID=A0AA39I422_9BILA|nr:hypothetical protein QR680_012586 [Steinernema hermaphroditum]
MPILRCLLLLGVVSSALLFEAPRYGCGQSQRCSLVISALRNPRHLSAWNTDAWTKAIGQLQAYQELFSSDDSQYEQEKRSIVGVETPKLKAMDSYGYDPYYWMLGEKRRR